MRDLFFALPLLVTDDVEAVLKVTIAQIHSWLDTFYQSINKMKLLLWRDSKGKFSLLDLPGVDPLAECAEELGTLSECVEELGTDECTALELPDRPPAATSIQECTISKHEYARYEWE